MIKIQKVFLRSFTALETQILAESQRINIYKKDGTNHVAVSTWALRCLHSGGGHRSRAGLRGNARGRWSQSTFWVSDTSVSSSRQPVARWTYILANNISYTVNTAHCLRPGLSGCSKASFTHGITVLIFTGLLDVLLESHMLQILTYK